ncbi:DUF4258 domain-containing protein [uncultured Devosia sp.]|uniref:DUF4258 domain-containing protein n=1 Tax=uncultured Devosia sp. TaxID=211434 RepID=UPI0026297890|nr:DUF4258 domain-containing protein [uncultured Devosia sp.]
MAKAITYTKHAMTAISERGLRLDWVELVARHPQWTEPDPIDPEVVRHFGMLPELGGRFLRVALVETDTEYRIVSTFLDRRAKPK